MKKLVSAILILVMLFGCACASEYNGTMEDALAMLNLMYDKYMENKDVDDQFLEVAFGNAILYLDCNILWTAHITQNSGLIDLYAALISKMCDIRNDYRKGLMLRKTYANELFSFIKEFVIDYWN